MSSCSGSDDEYDPAEVTLHTTDSAVTTATTTSTAADDKSQLAALLSRSVARQTFTPTAGATEAAAASSAGRGETALSHDSHPAAHCASNTVEGGSRLYSDIKGRIRCLALNPAGTILCAGSEDGQLCMWDFNVPLKTHRVQPTRVLTPFVNRISGLQPIIALAWATGGGYCVACQDGDSPVLVRASGEQLGYCATGERGLMDVVQCRGHRAPVTCVAAHTHDVAAFYTGSQDGTVRLWSSATFKQRSVYAVKHGSGQVTDTHVVESVASLDGLHGGQGCVFASGGQDGRVQVWDSRVKYRPGGALASVDMFATVQDPFAEKHVGGMVELRVPESGATPATHSYSLAVRLGSTVNMIDLRRLSSGATTNAASVVAQEVASGLPHVLDTTVLSVGCSGDDGATVVTCTSRAGYRHGKGGHVVHYRCAESGGLEPTLVWHVGKHDEDVLCACVDTSRSDGCVFAGLSSGEVAVHHRPSVAGSTPQPVEAWLHTRPEREGHGRVVGAKAPRAGRDDDDDLMRDLF
ncbi:WD domain, G-beta repeat [Novymonas esmeraldas]|uniref:WD domain, G-beta repeat n=1 Tax=Novymonas esmeraldas TaxID=1808958 RepID=A0AAW0EKZ3_9TRYP